MIFFIAVEKIRQRWKSIRDSYVKFLNKVEKAGSVLRIKPYKFEKHLKFLDPFICQPKDGSQIIFDSDDTQIESPDQILSVTHVKMEEDQCSINSEYHIIGLCLLPISIFNFFNARQLTFAILQQVHHVNENLGRVSTISITDIP